MSLRKRIFPGCLLVEVLPHRMSSSVGRLRNSWLEDCINAPAIVNDYLASKRGGRCGLSQHSKQQNVFEPKLALKGLEHAIRYGLISHDLLAIRKKRRCFHLQIYPLYSEYSMNPNISSLQETPTFRFMTCIPINSCINSSVENIMLVLSE